MIDPTAGRLKISTRLFIIMLCCITASAAALLVAAKTAAQAMVEQYLYGYLSATQAQVGNGIEMLLDDINAAALRIMSAENIKTVLTDQTLSAERRESIFRNTVSGLSIDEDIIGDVMLVDQSGRRYLYRNSAATIGTPDDTFFASVADADSLYSFGGVERDSDNNAYLLVGKAAKSLDSGKPLGFIVVYVKESAVRGIYGALSSELGESYIVGDNNVIVSHPDPSAVGSIIYNKDIRRDGSDYYSYTEKINNSTTIISVSALNNQMTAAPWNFYIISEISYDTLFDTMKSIDVYVFAIGVVIVLLSALVSAGIARGIARPLRVLSDKLRDLGSDDVFSESLYSQTGDEIWELEKAYNEMTERIAGLIEKNNLEMEKQRELELLALQQEINPHLLYNTLDAIGWIARLKKQPDIERLILALANFFRISLHNGDKYIEVREEIDLIKNFVKIQDIRFPGKIRMEYNIPPELEHSVMLKLILQPLVENAIKHGVSQLEGGGAVTINCRAEGDFLVFTISDTGEGFTVPDDLLSPDSAAATRRGRGGYGLKNVDERIRLEYGEGCGLKIESAPGKGTVATVRIRQRESP